MMVWALVNEKSVVLEFGARYATTSCVLSYMTGNVGNVVSVDPDPTAKGDALQNMYKHK